MTEKERRPGIQETDGYLHRVAPTADCTGNIFSHVLKPLMAEFQPRDLMQVIAGTSILALPAAFTEEPRRLGQTLPFRSVLILSAVSLLFIAIFVYFNFYRFAFNGHAVEYGKRVFSIYLVSLAAVGALLTVIRQAPWTSVECPARDQAGDDCCLPSINNERGSQRMP